MQQKNPSEQNQTLTGAPSPEELEAAQAANEVDAMEALPGLQAEIAALQVKNTELADSYLRAKAEAENARRRADEEVSKARKFALESFAESLLPVADSLEAGLQLKEANAEQIREGTQATLKQLKSALERNRVMAIDPAAGDKFDPHQHQAISMVPLAAESSQEANTVVTVLQKGYLIADRVLRPALVTVAAPK
jgi:molecular chaperone GrpE